VAFVLVLFGSGKCVRNLWRERALFHILQTV
jgi:hypothetical protein